MASLRQRASGMREAMDDPACDVRMLNRTYRQFALVNAAVSGWRRVYRRRIRPLLAEDRVTTLLDVGCGGGDLVRTLMRWAARDGVRLQVTGIDPDERAIDFATGRPAPEGAEFRRAHTRDLVAAGERFDLVVSNHVLHHLDGDELATLLADSEALGSRLALHADITRSRTAAVLFGAATLPLAGTSFIRRDGLISIRRSYTPAELRAVVPDAWRVAAASPFRYLLTRAFSRG